MITHHLETKGKVIGFSAEIKDTKENRNFRTKNYNDQKKYWQIRMGETEVRVSELDDGAMEITLFEQQREKIDWKKENRVSGTCGTIIKDLPLISFQKEKRENTGMEIYLKI